MQLIVVQYLKLKMVKRILLELQVLRLPNSFEKQIGYTLVINNGTQLFKYNEAGLSPKS